MMPIGGICSHSGSWCTGHLLMVWIKLDVENGEDVILPEHNQVSLKVRKLGDSLLQNKTYSLQCRGLVCIRATPHRIAIHESARRDKDYVIRR